MKRNMRIKIREKNLQEKGEVKGNKAKSFFLSKNKKRKILNNFMNGR